MTQVLRIDLPWPPAHLSPNARVHWSEKHKAAKRYRATCHTAALLVTRGRRAMDVPLHVELVFRPPPDHRERDRDNLLASMKAGLDGVASALQIDDSRFRPIPDIGAPAASKAEACVELTLSVANETNPRPARTSRAADYQKE